MKELPKRKHPRLGTLDYSQNGAYFVTICVRDRKCLLGKVTVGRDDLIPPLPALSPIGKIVEDRIQSIERAYPTIGVAGYVVMPNHIHVLLVLEGGGMGSCRPTGLEERQHPTVMMIVRGFKRQTTMALGKSIWQASFHDHIIRDENDFLNHWQYIENNPARWAEDEYYQEQ